MSAACIGTSMTVAPSFTEDSVTVGKQKNT